MAMEPMAFFSGFAWSVPMAFSDAVGACQFSRGDTLYSNRIAYRQWNEEFYKLAKDLHAIKVLSPEAKPAPPSPGLFQSNWNSAAESIPFLVEIAKRPPPWIVPDALPQEGHRACG